MTDMTRRELFCAAAREGAKAARDAGAIVSGYAVGAGAAMVEVIREEKAKGPARS